MNINTKKVIFENIPYFRGISEFVGPALELLRLEVGTNEHQVGALKAPMACTTHVGGT